MKRKSILLVEDEAVVREMIRGALEREYDVLEASGYSEALGHLKNQIDLALVDYVLPDRDGFEVLRAVRKAKPALPFILMTGYGSDHVVIRALRGGVTDYIKKPVSFSYLLRRLREILGTGPSNTLRRDTAAGEELDMDSIASYIDDHCMEHLSLDKLARMAGMSRFNFCRAFKGRFGVSFISCLKSVRVRKAAGLLEDRTLTIAEIATFVGYESAAYFGRVFKTVYGVSPSEFRGRADDRPAKPRDPLKG